MSDSTSVSSPQAQELPMQKRPSSSRRSRIMLVLGLLMAAALLAWAARWFFVWRFEETTDDAYVAGNVVRIMSQISGRVVSVLADDTDSVRAGQPLVRLDDDDARLALDRALVDLASVVREIARLEAQRRESLALIKVAEVTLEQGITNLRRREILGREKAVRLEEVQDFHAQVKSSTAQLDAARQRQKALDAQLLHGPVEDQPMVRQAAARVRECWLTLQRTVIRSPVDGQVAQRSVQSGQVVAAGTPLMAVIPLNSLWVEANFTEVQLRHMRVGQPASIRVDMHGSGVTYQGRVAGFSAGTGSAFALIPAQNATGNWIKVVQRVPVRIELEGKDAARHSLLIGLSSLVTVNIDDASGPLLTDAARQRPLPPVLTAQGTEPDMDPIEERIRSVIAENSPPVNGATER